MYSLPPAEALLGWGHHSLSLAPVPEAAGHTGEFPVTISQVLALECRAGDAKGAQLPDLAA